MKILKSILTLFVCISFVACGSDDDGAVTVLDNASIAGTYEVVYFEGTEVESDGSTGVVVSRTNFVGDTFTNATFTFTVNGLYSSTGSYRITATETITGQSPTTETEIEDFDDTNLPYSVNSTNRTITLDGVIGDVMLFDGNNLRITTEEVETFNGNVFTFNSEIRLVRQN